MIWVVAGLVLVAVFVMFRMASGGEEKHPAGSDIPLNIMAEHASQLSNNRYVATGTIVDRFQRGAFELVAFVKKDSSGKEYIIPVCISPEVRNGLNINRDQQYRIEFEVKDLSPQIRGVCVATSIIPN